MTIGEKIKALRKRHNMSVEELASKLGKNRATVYRYEKGDIENLPLDALNPLAKALRTTPAYLMGWGNDKEEFSQEIQEFLEEDRQERFKTWIKEFGHLRLTDDEYDKLLEYAKFLEHIRED